MNDLHAQKSCQRACPKAGPAQEQMIERPALEQRRLRAYGSGKITPKFDAVPETAECNILHARPARSPQGKAAGSGKTADMLHGVLRGLGIYENRQGYRAVTVAVEIAMCKPQSLTMVTKWLYPEAARQCGMSWQALEKNLRMTVSYIWNTHPDRLQMLAGETLRRKPTASQFIALLASGLKDSQFARL